MIKRIASLVAAAVLLGVMGRGLGQAVLDAMDRMSAEEYLAHITETSRRRDARGLAEPFKGVTTDGAIVPGLYSIRSTGVSTEPVRTAAQAFLEALTEDQRRRTQFSVDEDEWRKWMNVHAYLRQGVGFDEFSDAQRAAAMNLLASSLSAKGLKLSEDIMKLNATLGELNGDDFIQYGDDKYYFTVMGLPSATEPWGWQLDGHHLALNYFVLGDQVVMTPAFWGSEPAIATSGKYKGTAVLQEEQAKALAMLRALDEAQRAEAVLSVSKTGNNALGQAFSDNLVLDYAGVSAASFSATQRMQLMELIYLWVGNLREGHAQVRMSEIADHLDDTYFAWIGGTEDNSVYYFRIQSPVILIEFDHETPIGLRHLYPPGVPFREHVHSVVRTPNGNDYGKDLLRQHYAMHPH